DIFHDVDFAAGRPANGIDVVTEHPERGPDSLAFWDLETRLETPVGLGEVSSSLKPSRGVVSSNPVGARECFLKYRNDEIAIFLEGILGTVGVVLEFVVAPAVAASFENPFARVGCGAVRTGEIVAPSQCPAGGGRGWLLGRSPARRRGEAKTQK